LVAISRQGSNVDDRTRIPKTERQHSLAPQIVDDQHYIRGFPPHPFLLWMVPSRDRSSSFQLPHLSHFRIPAVNNIVFFYQKSATNSQISNLGNLNFPAPQPSLSTMPSPPFHDLIPPPFYIAGWIIVEFLWLQLCFNGLWCQLDFGMERYTATNDAVTSF